jgi:hypothetical protein
MKTSRILGLAAVIAVASPAFAQYDITLPPAKSMNGIKYIDGGIGQLEAAAMYEAAKTFPLNLVFSAGAENNYLASVRVTIKSAGKTVFEATSGGPILLVDLPAGKYSIEAEFRGKTVRQSAEVLAKGPRRLDFHWPGAD